MVGVSRASLAASATALAAIPASLRVNHAEFAVSLGLLRDE
jgi:hypothetical protein